MSRRYRLLLVITQSSSKGTENFPGNKVSLWAEAKSWACGSLIVTVITRNPYKRSLCDLGRLHPSTVTERYFLFPDMYRLMWKRKRSQPGATWLRSWMCPLEFVVYWLDAGSEVARGDDPRHGGVEILPHPNARRGALQGRCERSFDGANG